MDRSKIVAIVTGLVSLFLAIGYLLLVQILDFRGEMIPAPLSTLSAVVGWLNPGLDLIHWATSGT
jgi:hypothetical protein